MPDTTNTIFDPGTISTILKWAITILIAGFIAQFGKKFANYLTEKIKARRRKKSGEGAVAAAHTGDAGIESGIPEHPGVVSAEIAKLKLKKKMSKNAAKARKKGL
jgi:hypothetical protein